MVNQRIASNSGSKLDGDEINLSISALYGSADRTEIEEKCALI
jgi:hypothetical protein